MYTFYMCSDARNTHFLAVKCNLFNSVVGAETHTRSDVVLQILIEDMQRMIEKFSISYMAATSHDSFAEIHRQKFRELKENWKKTNRRGLGHYAKAPDASVLNNLKHILVTSATSINEGLSLPNLPIENWLNVAIGLLVSIKSIRDSLPFSPANSTPLLNQILTFIHQWISCLNRIKLPKRTSTELMQLLNTKFALPMDSPNNISDQLHFILHDILLPTIHHSLSIITCYHCTSCQFTMHARYNISYIPINVVERELKLNNLLTNYFTGGASDHLCERCSMSMSRKIKLLDCK